jgi:hypothetical protein
MKGRTMTPRSVSAALAVAALVAGGCGNSAGDRKSAQEPGGTASPAAGGERSAAIYAAVVRRLVTKDHTVGGADPGFTKVYVIDGAVPGAADPFRSTPSRRARGGFSAALKRALTAKLSDLPPLEFVSRRADVVEGENGGAAPGRVVNGGVLLTLGPIRGGDDRVTVGGSLWLSGLAGSWQTYVVEQKGGRWAVTGTTGPAAIS